ncbi:MAG: inositol monophosphatase [Actinomycetota bacterium]|nr:inositol monophosphatase [Actinomycetota bacterium]
MTFVASDPQALRRLATRLAVGGGEIAAAGAAAIGVVDDKSSATDLVTQHDRATEQWLVDELRAARPGDAVIGEEGTAISGTSGYEWYLDPIDGTTNYVHGHTMWATSVAVGLAGDMVAGAVAAPALGEVFAAARDAGATCNDLTISAASDVTLGRALIATGFSYDVERRRMQARRMAQLIDRVADIRRGGSAALDLCFVAAGRVDGYYEEFLNVWDLAAGELIAREAGCLSAPIGGTADPSGIVVAAPGVFGALHDVLATTR